MAELAVVTGGASGIGYAIAEGLRREGYDVRTPSRRSGLDLLDRAAIARYVAGLPRLDVLVNNAGIAESAPIEKTDDAMWDRHLALNVTAPFLLVRAALPLLRRAPKPRVVNIASTAALHAGPYIAAYAASKHALLGLTRAMAAELKGIAVNAVCPGFVDSPLTDRSVARIMERTGRGEAEARETLARQNPSGRLLAPEEVAAAVLELLRSDETGREVVLG